MMGFYAAGAMGSSITPAVPMPFFISDPMLSTGWETVSFPSGFYNASQDKTYVAWQFVGLGGYKGVRAAAFDHSSGAWSSRHTVGNFLLANDDHGHPAMVRDADGYIHCFYGSHNNPQKYSVTNSPDDVSTWTQRPDVGTALTYPKPVLVGSTIYLFVRNSADSNELKLALSTMTPASGVGTFGALKNLVAFGAITRVYTTETHAIGTDIHFCCMYTSLADTERRGVYYFIYDTTTGAIRNYDGSVSVSSGSQPISKATADSSFRIFDHGVNDGDVPSLQFDSAGNAHVIFAFGTTPTYDLMHMMLSGGSWSSPVSIATLTDISPSSGYVGIYCLVPGAGGRMEAWYNVNGDKVRRVRSSGGTWAPAETIATAGAYDFVQCASVLGADPALRTLFSENLGSVTDASAVPLGLYAYGDSGPANTPIDMTPIDPSGFGNVSMLLNCYGRNGAVSVIDDSKNSVRMALAGNAQISTAQTPFVGGASLRLDGAGDYITALDNAAYSVAGTGDFAMDLWFRMNETGRVQVLFAKRQASAGSSEYTFYITAANQIGFLMWGASNAVAINLTGTTVISTGVWRYAEAGRVSGTTYLFLDGGLEASGVQSIAPVTSAQALLIGRDPSNSARDFNGWIAEPRFTRAGRHSSGYSVPTTWHPRQ